MPSREECEPTSEAWKPIYWLVVWNICDFPYIGNNHPNWLIFSEGLKPPTSCDRYQCVLHSTLNIPIKYMCFTDIYTCVIYHLHVYMCACNIYIYLCIYIYLFIYVWTTILVLHIDIFTHAYRHKYINKYKNIYAYYRDTKATKETRELIYIYKCVLDSMINKVLEIPWWMLIWWITPSDLVTDVPSPKMAMGNPWEISINGRSNGKIIFKHGEHL